MGRIAPEIGQGRGSDSSGPGTVNPSPGSSVFWAFADPTTRNGWTGYHNNINPLQAAWAAFVPFGRFSNTLGEYIEWNIWLDAGSYAIDTMNFLSTHFGLGQWLLDGVVQFTQDQSATGDAHVTYIRAGTFTVSTSGMHALRYAPLNQAGAHTLDSNFVDIYAFVLRGGRVGKIPFPPTDTVVSAIRTSGDWSHSGAGWIMLNTSNGPTVSITDGAGNIYQAENVPYTMTNQNPGSPGAWIEGSVWLDAGTYALDYQGYLGNNQCVFQLKVDGTAVGTPQAAGTVRELASTSSPGNGNIGGSALSTGEVDLFDNCATLPTNLNDGHTGTFATFTENAVTNIPGFITNALTNIVVSVSGWHTIRVTSVGKNSAAAAGYSLTFQGFFRRTA